MSLYQLDPREQLVDVKLEGGLLVISIGIDFLTRVTVDILNDQFPNGPIKLTESTTFADEIRAQLLCEREDGSTAVHRMFTEAANDAIDNGCQGIEMVSPDYVDIEDDE